MNRLLEYLQQPGNSQTALANSLGLSQPAIAKWLERQQIPAERVLEVSRLTGIPAFELRPDIYPERAA